jgi:uncharacterized protein YlaI
MYVRLYRTTQPDTELFLEKQFHNQPIHRLLAKYCRFLKVHHAMAILCDVADILDDKQLDGCPRYEAAFSLLQLLFRDAGFTLTWTGTSE